LTLTHFALSLPERLVRSLAALCGGLLREIGVVVVPLRVRRTVLYRLMVEVTLRFLIAQVGQVKGVYPSESQIAGNFLLRRGASHGLELIGLLTIHVSPIWVLAALADATGAGRALIQQITGALVEEGLISGDAHFETVDQLLDGLEKMSGHLAEAMNMPPIHPAELRRELTRFRAELPSVPQANLPTPEHLQDVWNKLQELSKHQKRSLFTVCSVMAVSAVTSMPSRVVWLSRAAHVAVRRTGEVIGEELLMHYVNSADQMTRAGVAEYWRHAFRPYLRAAAEQFAPSRVVPARGLRSIGAIDSRVNDDGHVQKHAQDHDCKEPIL
jgi:hypothetical protein